MEFALVDGQRHIESAIILADLAFINVSPERGREFQDHARFLHQGFHRREVESDLIVLTEDALDRVKSPGLILSMQPNFVARWSHPGGLYERRHRKRGGERSGRPWGRRI